MCVRERERERDSRTDRQTDRQREREREPDRQRERERESNTAFSFDQIKRLTLAAKPINELVSLNYVTYTSADSQSHL